MLDNIQHSPNRRPTEFLLLKSNLMLLFLLSFLQNQHHNTFLGAKESFETANVHTYIRAKEATLGVP